MKFPLLTAALALTTTILVHAQNEPMMALSRVVFKQEGGRLDTRDIYLMAATPNAIGYRFFPDADGMERSTMAEVDSLFIYDPKDYLDALNLLEGRKYAQAREAFAKVREKYEPLAGVPNNPSVLAGFYELECLRKLSDLEGLRKGLQTYKRDALTLKSALQQLELYVMWDGVRAQTWQKVEELALQYRDKRLPGNLRAQVAYCLGRALEGLEKPQGEVLLAYQTAMIADAGASEIIARDAALRTLEILHDDAELKDAIKAYDASEGEELIKGYTKVLEAAGVASMFQLGLGNGQPLPDKYLYLLKYKQNNDGEAPAGKKEDGNKDS